jgi:DNA-directed RNA polymerase specialized sigma24 family protein
MGRHRYPGPARSSSLVVPPSRLVRPCRPDEPRAYLLTIARRLVFETWRRRDLERAWLAELAALPEALTQALTRCYAAARVDEPA